MRKCVKVYALLHVWWSNSAKVNNPDGTMCTHVLHSDSTCSSWWLTHTSGTNTHTHTTSKLVHPVPEKSHTCHKIALAEATSQTLHGHHQDCIIHWPEIILPHLSLARAKPPCIIGQGQAPMHHWPKPSPHPSLAKAQPTHIIRQAYILLAMTLVKFIVEKKIASWIASWTWQGCQLLAVGARKERAPPIF